MNTKRFDKYSVYRILAIVVSIVLNAGLYYLMSFLGIPLYLDTIGTIFISMLCGTFPGVFTAVATNFICEFFYADSVYYSFIGIVIAIIAAWFSRNEKYRSKRNVFGLVALLAAAGGVIGTLFQWALLGDIQFPFIAEAANSIVGDSKALYFFVSMFFIFAINVVDKGIAVCAAIGAICLIPEETRQRIKLKGWKQAPLSLAELKSIKEKTKKTGKSLKVRISLMLIIATVVLVLVFTWVTTGIYSNSITENGKESAKSTAVLSKLLVEPDEFVKYLKSNMNPTEYGEINNNYKKTSEKLISLVKTIPDVEEIYIYQVREDGVYLIFDTAPAFMEQGTVGEKVGISIIDHLGIEKFIKGEFIETVEYSSTDGYFATAFSPVFDSDDKCVAYVSADVSLNRLDGYVQRLFLNLILIFSGFFVLILAYGLKAARTYLEYPVGSLEESIDGFMQSIEDQDKLDENVKKLQKLDIATNDEIESLYKSICEMAVGTAEQMRSIRLLARKNEKMQAGLIITMADMVESRDADTGDHVLKTAAYVKIILEGLRRKGYYCEKITDKYIKDVEMSAPLHDVGKINVSDTILNKPGKLTEEEYEIMKTHTTAGKKILENAISSVQGENYLKEARNMAAYHHERWDGKGYPEGLHGQVIPLSARVMAVADVFDALASPRVYKPAFSLEKALQIIREGSGTQFDPKCVEVFLDSIADIKKVLKKYQDSYK